MVEERKMSRVVVGPGRRKRWQVQYWADGEWHLLAAHHSFLRALWVKFAVYGINRIVDTRSS